MRIDDSKHLVRHLGIARTDRIRYAQFGRHRRQPGATNIENPVFEEMQHLDSHIGHPIEDILYGVAAVCDNARSLNTLRLFNILQCMEIINTREIQHMMAISPRQARKYLQAIRIALPYIIITFRTIKDRRRTAQHANQEAQEELRSDQGPDRQDQEGRQEVSLVPVGERGPFD